MRLGSYYRLHLLRELGLHDVFGRVLDLGGHDGLWASSLPAASSYVVDMRPLAVYEDVRYVSGDAQLLPFKGRSFDAVFALDVVEHVPDEARVIGEAIRVLRPKGRLILTTPHNEVRVFPGFLQSWVDRQWGHQRLRGFRPDDLARLLESLDVKDRRITCLATRAFRWGYLGLSLAWKLWQPFGQRLVRLAARVDAHRASGPGGSVLVEAVRPA